MNEWDLEFQKHLLAAGSFAEVLALFCPKERNGTLKRNPKPMSYAELSRRLGLRSRSHLREIVESVKPASRGLMHTFCRVLKVNTTWARYIEFLHGGPPVDAGQRALWLSELEILRNRLRKSIARREVAAKAIAAKPLLDEAEIPAVFAALGDVSTGASLDEIHARTKIPIPHLEGCLRTLIQSAAVEKKNDRYLAVGPHLIFEGLGGEEFFQRDLARSMERAKAKMKEADAVSSLFFNSTFCVRSSDLPKLRGELKQVLTRFVDEAENHDGERIVTLLGCFF